MQLFISVRLRRLLNVQEFDQQLLLLELFLVREQELSEREELAHCLRLHQEHQVKRDTSTAPS